MLPVEKGLSAKPEKRSFKGGNTSLKDKSKSRRPSVMGDEALTEMVEQLSTNTRTSSELDPS